VTLTVKLMRRCIVTLATGCLIGASILPSVAIACEGAGLEWEGSKEVVPLFQVSKANGFKAMAKNIGPAEAKKLKVKYNGEFEDNASQCNGLANLAVGNSCEVKIKCKAGAVIGNKGEVFVEGENFATLNAQLECVA
jgi:hypothetical protein